MATQLKGGPELLAFLDSLPEKLATNIIRGGLRAGAVEVAQEAKARANSAEIADGIYVTTGTRGGQIVAKVKLKGWAASLAIWGEFGTAAHWIRAKVLTDAGAGDRPKVSIRTLNRMARRGTLLIGKNFVGDVVHHPGAQKHPFLRPALEARAEAAVAAMANYIRTRIASGGLDAPDFGLDEDDDA